MAHEDRRRRARQASGIIGFIAMLVIAALLWALMGPAADLVFSAAGDTASSQAAQTAIDERKAIWGNILFYPLALAGVFVIARAILQSRRAG